MANDLMKTVAQKGKEGLKAIALSDNVQIVTAIANDESYNEIFAGQLKVLAHAKDVLIIISGSGNSPNIIRVLEEAKKMQLTTIGFLGKDGGKAKQMVDISLVVPSNDYGPIEDIHVIFNHLITAYLRNQ
jgi:D-sedoheptulose 7-phosphate isomerase